MIKELIAFFCSIIVMSIMFGLAQLLCILADKVEGLERVKKYSMQCIALVVTIIMYSTMKINTRVCDFSSLIIYRYYLYIIIIILIVSVISAMNNEDYHEKSNKENIINSIDGMLMEIPQRLFMQIFLFTITKSIYSSIVLNAIVWCTGILIQAIIFKQKLDIIFIREELASFIFSIGIGYVFAESECIIFAMISHAFERYLTEIIRKRNATLNSQV